MKGKAKEMEDCGIESRKRKERGSKEKRMRKKQRGKGHLMRQFTKGEGNRKRRNMREVKKETEKTMGKRQ